MTTPLCPWPFGYFERVVDDGELLSVGGWMLWHSGAADRLVFYNDAGEQLPARCTPRPDLAPHWPRVRDAARGGFAAELPLAHMARGELFECHLRGERAGRSLGSMPLRYHRSPAPLPLPPRALIERITLHPSEDFFTATGRLSTNDLLALLAPWRPLRAVRRLLDWGCGCGRQTRYLLERLPQAEVHGVDRDRECIAWLQRHHARGVFRCAGDRPPLPYADGQFDAIVATAVLTHMSLAEQRTWLPELHRLLAPDGVLLATTHGSAATVMAADTRIAAAMATRGCFDGVDDAELPAAGPESYFRATYQRADQFRTLVAPWFEPLDLLEAGLHGSLDVWVLGRRLR